MGAGTYEAPLGGHRDQTVWTLNSGWLHRKPPAVPTVPTPTARRARRKDERGWGLDHSPDPKARSPFCSAPRATGLLGCCRGPPPLPLAGVWGRRPAWRAAGKKHTGRQAGCGCRAHGKGTLRPAPPWDCAWGARHRAQQAQGPSRFWRPRLPEEIAQCLTGRGKDIQGGGH